MTPEEKEIVRKKQSEGSLKRWEGKTATERSEHGSRMVKVRWKGHVKKPARERCEKCGQLLRKKYERKNKK